MAAEVDSNKVGVCDPNKSADESGCVISEQQGWKVEIDIASFNGTGVDTEEIINYFIEKSGIDPEDLSVTIKFDDAGEVVRIIVYVNDEEIATAVEIAVKDCIGDSAGAECPDVLQHTREMRVIPPEEIDASSLPSIVGAIFMIVIAMIVSTTTFSL